jgi:hypothetical protein
MTPILSGAEAETWIDLAIEESVAILDLPQAYPVEKMTVQP